MMHPATELRLIDDDVGYGVFATAPGDQVTNDYAELGDAAKEALAVAASVAQPLASLLPRTLRRRLLEPRPAETEHRRCWRIRDLEPAKRRQSAAVLRHP